MRWGLALGSTASAFIAFNAIILALVFFRGKYFPDFLTHPGYLSTLLVVSAAIGFTIERWAQSRLLCCLFSGITSVVLFFVMAFIIIVTR